MSEGLAQIASQERDFTSIEEAVEHSMYRERMFFLLQNPQLGHKPIRMSGRYKETCSNCFGTTLCIIGKESIFRRSTHSKEENGAIILGEPGSDTFCIFPLDEQRPGYVGTEFMEGFIKNRCTQSTQKEKDCIIATTGKYVDDEGFHKGYGLLHTCIYLGRIQGKSWVIHQEQEGKSYEAIPLCTFSNVEKTKFYTPR